jgi:hypothetical protein
MQNKYISKFFIESNRKFEKINLLSAKDLKYLLDKTIDLLSIPSPSKELKKHFIAPEIVQRFLIELFNSGFKTYDERNEIAKEFDKLFKKIKVPKSEHQVKLRILDKDGYYPNCDLKRRDTEYSKLNFLPILITKYQDSTEIDYSNWSEIRWINRKELKVATCCLLAPTSGICCFYFPDYNQIELKQETLSNIPENIQKYFLIELLHFTNRFKPLYQAYREREATPDITAYKYFPFDSSIEAYNRLFDRFSIQDHLLMRTSNFLLKSYMLWQNRNFGEDAIANVLFCLEGCLRLIYKKYSSSDNKFNIKELEVIFDNLFPKGKELFSFIREGYDKRISLVHAEPDWGAEWCPFLLADDFFDYFNICRELLNLILIDRYVEY